jgi:ATP-dependent RNA helicase RhlE
MIFDDLNLNPELLESIDYMGFREATPIQEKAIPVILAGRDLIACAQTGYPL